MRRLKIAKRHESLKKLKVSNSRKTQTTELTGQVRDPGALKGDPFAFLTSIVAKHQKIEGGLSQAAACDGTRISTTAVGQDVAPGTLPIY